MSPTLLLVAALGAAPQAELLDFSAKWCVPCQSMSPIVSRLQRQGFPIRQVDVDRYPDLAKHYGVSSIPAFVLVVNGREVERHVGVMPEERLIQILHKIPASSPPASEPGRKKGKFSWPIGSAGEPTAEPPQFGEDSGAAKLQDDDAIIRLQNDDAVRTQPANQLIASASSGAPPAAQDPIQTAVRIKVRDDKGGTDLGSGTVIGSKQGQALILTCWHIFREFGDRARVEVDLFPAGPDGKPQTIPGQLLSYDEKADVALVGISGCTLMPVSPIAAVDQFPQPNDHVFSIGCGQGKPPARIQHRVTRINPYDGPDTTECTGMPQVGRSGGGLFDKAGRVIGVCFAAEKQNQTGVYVGPAEIHKLLTNAGFAKLIPASSPASQFAGTKSVPAPERLEQEPLGEPEESDANPFDTDAVVGSAVADITPSPRPDFSPAGSDASTALAAVEAGAEVVCTIRPLKPGSPTEVVVINKASRKFLRYLKGELDSQPVQTSMRVRPDRSSRADLVTADLATTAVGTVSHVIPGIALLVRVFDNHGRP